MLWGATERWEWMVKGGLFRSVQRISENRVSGTGDAVGVADNKAEWRSLEDEGQSSSEDSKLLAEAALGTTG